MKNLTKNEWRLAGIILAVLIFSFSIETNKETNQRKYFRKKIISSIEYRYWGLQKFHKTNYVNGSLKSLENLNKKDRRKLLEYYENGNLKYEAQLAKNSSVFIGNYKEYYKNGNLKFKGNYKNDLLHGQVEAYYENGNLKFKKTFQLGKNKEDVYLSEEFKKLNYLISKNYDFFSKEIKPHIKNITFNKKNGEIEVDFNKNKKEVFIYNDENTLLKRTLYDPNGKLVFSEEYYRDGSLKLKTSKNGNFTVYNRNGSIAEEIIDERVSFFSSKNGNFSKISSEYRTLYFYENGNLKKLRWLSPGGDRGSVYYDKDGMIIESEGFDRYTNDLNYRHKYYKNGNLKSYYKGNNYKEFYEDSTLKLSVKRFNKKNDIIEGFYENGNIKYRGEYKNKKRNGLYESYYEDGRLKFKGYYKNGEKK